MRVQVSPSLPNNTMTKTEDARKYMTTVKELIETLSKLPGDHMVVLQKDAEGNGYSPLAGAEVAKYIPEATWYGEVPHPEDLANGEYGEADLAEMIDCVVIHPIN